MRLISIFFVLSSLTSCSALNRKLNLPDDNIIEEFIENIIENQVGLEIDLTPDSEE